MSSSKRLDTVSGPLHEKLLTLLHICQRLNSERNLPALLDLIAREGTRLMDSDRASIFLLDRAKHELCSQVALGTDEMLRFDVRLGIAGAVVETGEAIWTDDAPKHPRFLGRVDAHTGYETRSLLAVPLWNLRGETIGVFEVVNKKQGRFNDEDVQVARNLATNIAIAVETAQLVGELSRSNEQLLASNNQLWKEVEGRFSTQQILGTDPKIRSVLSLIEQVADSSVSILITGESGTGKELAAKAIHYNSTRGRRPFVALNCAALPEALVESELFGVEKGVATGVEARIGKFEAADQGTLFLDEIGDLSMFAQAKLLRVLQERVVERVGGRRPRLVDVRVLAATNKQLESEIQAGKFREDLLFRIKVVHIHMPPLREMRQDIPLLANHFLTVHCREMGRPVADLSAEVTACLMNYHWPGNVRELDNEMKRLAVTARGDRIDVGSLSERIGNAARTSVSSDRQISALKDSVADLERRMITDALNTCGHNQQQAAQKLGLSRQGLIKKMLRYGLQPRRGK